MALGGIRPAAYQSVTLSPKPAPVVAAAPVELAPAQAVPQFDDAFFEEAFEGLTEAGPSGTAPVAGPAATGVLKGYLEDCSPDRIAGWAQDSRPGAAPVRVAVMLGRLVLAEVLANLWRADLSAAGIGTGHHAFEFRPVPPMARDLLGAVRIIRLPDKAELPRVFELVNQ